MRAEDIVGLSFFLVLFAGIGLMLYGTTRPVGTRERPLWQAAGLGVQGFAFLAFGLATLDCIRTSARVVVVGNVWDVREPMRGSASFKVTDEAGRVELIRCRYDGPGLHEGERARVRYVAFNRKLVELTMLSGSSAGWELKESAGELSPLLFAGVGLVCWFAGWRVWRKDVAKEESL